MGVHNPIRIWIKKAGTLIGKRRRINLIEGSNISMTVADNPGTKSVDVTINSPLTGLNNFYFYKTASDIGGYYQMLDAASTGALQTITNAGVIDGQTLASFATISTRPNITLFPASDITFKIYSHKTAGTKTLQLYAEFYKRASGGAETLIATSGYSGVVAGLDAEYTFTATVPSDVNFLATDRYVVKIKAYVTGAGSAPDVELNMEDNEASRVELFQTVVDLSNYQTLISSPTNDNVVTTDGSGQTKDSGVSVDELELAIVNSMRNSAVIY